MQQIVYRPCYCTREDVRRALDVKQAAYSDDRLDRGICAAADAVEMLTQRRFYPEDGTRKFDWPNYQYAYPWVLYLDQHELAAQPTLVTTGSLLPSPITIPSTDFIMQPINDGPPYTSLELRRDKNSAFGNNTTPQLDIALTGTFGYWNKTRSAGQLSGSMGSGDTTLTVTDGALFGVGDVLIADSERMIVTDMQYEDTGAGFLSGMTTTSAADNTGSVAHGASFDVGEVILLDYEWMLIQNIIGNTVIVKRGWGGSQLAAHADGHIYARRTATVLRGQLGTTSATHSNGTALTTSLVPGLIRQLAIAEAEVYVISEAGGYGMETGGFGTGAGWGVAVGQTGAGEARESTPGSGVIGLRSVVFNSRFTRGSRTRVILWGTGWSTSSDWTIYPARSTASGRGLARTCRRSLCWAVSSLWSGSTTATVAGVSRWPITPTRTPRRGLPIACVAGTTRITPVAGR